MDNMQSVISEENSLEFRSVREENELNELALVWMGGGAGDVVFA